MFDRVVFKGFLEENFRVRKYFGELDFNFEEFRSWINGEERFLQVEMGGNKIDRGSIGGVWCMSGKGVNSKCNFKSNVKVYMM